MFWKPEDHLPQNMGKFHVVGREVSFYSHVGESKMRSGISIPQSRRFDLKSIISYLPNLPTNTLMGKINHAAVWVSVVLLFGLGFLWYGPLFGESWMKMVGLDMATVEANPPGTGAWITNFIATVVPLYVLAWLFVKLGVSSGVEGAGIGLLIAFSFTFLSALTGNLFAQMPYALAWITGGFDMTAMTLSGFILGTWRKKDS